MNKKRKLENFDFDKPTRKTIAVLKRKTGWTKKAIVQKAIRMAETSLQFLDLV